MWVKLSLKVDQVCIEYMPKFALDMGQAYIRYRQSLHAARFTLKVAEFTLSASQVYIE